MSEILGERNLEERLKEICSTIERMDFRWDSGFITDKAEYLEKRLKLQQELEQLTPVQDELDQAADLLANFQVHWDDCNGDVEKQHQLIKLIIERVYVEDDVVMAITLKSNYHVVLGHKANEPTFMEVDPHIHVWARRGTINLLFRRKIHPSVANSRSPVEISAFYISRIGRNNECGCSSTHTFLFYEDKPPP